MSEPSPYFQDVDFTEHFDDRNDADGRLHLPQDQVERIILRRKGRQFLDAKTDVLHFQYNKTTIIVDESDENSEVAKVVTTYRKNPHQYKQDRYTEIR